MWSKNTEDSWSCKQGQDKCSRCIWSLIDRALKMNLTKLIRRDTGEQMKDRDLCNNIYICKCMAATTNTYSTYVGCFQYFAQRWQDILPICVVKDEVHQDQAGSLVPKWFSGAQAPTIQCKACTTTNCSGAYNLIQCNACTATRCLDYDQVLRRLIYCFAD